MRAVAVIPAERAVRVVDHPEPVEAGEGEVLVRTLEVGICGTDAELCAFHFGYPPRGDDHLVLGHEAVGEVVEAGPGVARLAAGDLVVPSVRRPCASPRCAACPAGYQDHCESGEFTERGIRGAHGFLTGRFVEHEDYLQRVPASLRRSAVLTEPLTIAEKSLRQFVAIRRRMPWLADADEAEVLRGVRVLVLGAGPVGLLGAMLLRSHGLAVTVYSREDPADERADIVRAIGGRYESANQLDVTGLEQRIGGVDMVYEAAGSARLSLDAAGALSPNGVFVVTGATGGSGQVDLAADAFLNRLVGGNRVIAGTVNAAAGDFAAAVADLEEFERLWPGVAPRLITHRHPLERFAERVMVRSGIKEVVELGAGFGHG